MKRTLDIVVIGTILKETIEFPERSVGPVLGSPCAYSSLIMSKLGLNVGMVSYYGNDFPEGMMEELRLVDKSGFMDYAYSTENHLIYQKDGSKCVEYYKTAPVIQFDDIPKHYLDAEFFFVCPMNYEVSIDVCVSIKEADKKLMVDLGGFGGTTVYNVFPIGTPRGDYYINSLCKVADIIKVSEEDLFRIMPGLHVEDAAQTMIDRGADIVAITMGEKGALYQTKHEKANYVEAFKSKVNEDHLAIVAAGDGFAAGFLYSYMKNGDLHEAVLYGNAVASLIIEKPGACVESRMPAPEVAELRKAGII